MIYYNQIKINPIQVGVRRSTDMYYDLSSFGSYICKKRKYMSYTQKDIANLAFLSTDTLRKIENGKVLPNQITLEALSLVLKEDLNLALLSYRLDNQDKFFEAKKEIEYKIANGKYTDLDENYERLKEILGNLNPNSYTYKLIKQLSLLIESILIKTVHSQYSQSLDRLIYAIKLTTPFFSLEKYRKFYYSDIEIRILMNIALLENKLGRIDSCQDILLFSLDHLDEANIDLRLRIIFNLSYTFHRKGLHNKALTYANQGIQLSIKDNNLTILGLLFFRKGIAEFNLKDDNHIVSLNRALSLHELSGQDNLKETLLEVCKKNKIDLNKA